MSNGRTSDQGGGIGGSGSADQIAYFVDPSTLTSSANLTFDGTTFKVNNKQPYYIGGATAVAIADGGTNATTANGALNNLLPAQTGNAGKVLTTDGTNTSWTTSSGYTDEQAQDAVGSILTNTSTISFTYNDAGNQITANVIDGSITLAKIQNIATEKILGRSTAGTGAIEVLGTIPNAVQDNITRLGTIVSGLWNGSIVSEIYGGTNQSSYALGDILYSSATNTLSKLTGNTTTTRKFLRQLGDGTNSAAPTWDTVSKTDVGLSAVENTALSTWAGSANITTLGTVTTGTWDGTAIGATSGGTGQTGFAVGDLLYASTTTALSKLADVAAGSYLRSGGVNTAPVWSTVTLPNSSAVGDLLYASATNVYSNLADVATGNALISGGVTTAPSWGKIGLTTHVSGVLPSANGGTVLKTAESSTRDGMVSEEVVVYTCPTGKKAIPVACYMHITAQSGSITTGAQSWKTSAGNTFVNGVSNLLSNVGEIAHFGVNAINYSGAGYTSYICNAGESINFFNFSPYSGSGSISYKASVVVIEFDA